MLRGEKGMAQTCPKCGREMVYYEQVHDWFCNFCQYYLRQLQLHKQPMDALSKRSILGITSLIVGAFCIVSIILMIVGSLMINIGVSTGYTIDWFIRGLMNIIISFILLLITYVIIHVTVGNKQWWTRIQKFVDVQGGLNVGNMSMKKNLVDIYQIFYGSLIIVGIISLTIGILLLNISNESSDFMMAGFDIMIGVILIFISYISYQKEMEKLSKDIYPIIFPKEGNISNATFNPGTKSEREKLV
jgi:hypothetical protein